MCGIQREADLINFFLNTSEDNSTNTHRYLFIQRTRVRLFMHNLIKINWNNVLLYIMLRISIVSVVGFGRELIT